MNTLIVAECAENSWKRIASKLARYYYREMGNDKFGFISYHVSATWLVCDLVRCQKCKWQNCKNLQKLVENWFSILSAVSCFGMLNKFCVILCV